MTELLSDGDRPGTVAIPGIWEEVERRRLRADETDGQSRERRCGEVVNGSRLKASGLW